MAGFQFTRLPAAQVSPEQDIQKQIETGRKNIQQKFALQWQTINANANFLGQQKHQAMLQQIDASAKQEMLEFNQQAEQQLESLRQVDRIAMAGGITPETQERLKASRVYGKDAANEMYPQEQSVMAQFGRLDTYGRIIDRQLEQFRISGPGGKPPSKLAFVTPITGAIATYRGMKRAAKRPTLQVFDPSIPAKDAKGRSIKDKFGEPVMGNWREARPEEIESYKLLSDAKRDIDAEQSGLLGGRDTKQRVIQPGTKGGTFGDKIATSYKKPVTKQRQQSTAAELRKQGTRAAYAKGVELGYWR